MKKTLHHIIGVILLLGLFSSCISTEETNYLQNIQADYTRHAYKEYKLNAGDYISCSISTGDEEFNQTFGKLIADDSDRGRPFLVYDNGTIVLPFFGEVELIGLTIQEAEHKVQKMMEESITDAHVNISLISNQFYILSDQGKKGVYVAYKENLTIYQALAISGQTTETMDLSRVKIVRKGLDGKTITKTFDLRTQDVVQSEFYYIYPNDLIYFPTNKNSFFNITSVGSFITTVTTPLAFLIFVTTYDF